ncbi:hypothetical protein ESCO_004285 [Escovopsis weberi]|uniref:Uncharacterized protein n=1 Tax=Escovopsis weberi TaxID=150374 RepID=A0A0M8N6M3_ESCWE|nr:hypothetical protein ESCO_004285 [Escovopsis weberi]
MAHLLDPEYVNDRLKLMLLGLADANEGGTNHTNDGRVKNPVPSKLKGMADNRNGNFGVMHIDISSSQAAFRNAAAKRLLGLSPHETKMEQARLLTLLRSLHPLVVVDQLCKALAYFGGVPNAPPPNHSHFPESAKNNGQGSLFISWVAEIFPHIDGSPGDPAGDRKGAKARKLARTKV